MIKSVETRETWSKEYRLLPEALADASRVVQAFEQAGWGSREVYIRQRQARLGSEHVWFVELEFRGNAQVEVPA